MLSQQEKILVEAFRVVEPEMRDFYYNSLTSRARRLILSGRSEAGPLRNSELLTKITDEPQ
jgi:hypothetical protein